MQCRHVTIALLAPVTSCLRLGIENLQLHWHLRHEVASWVAPPLFVKEPKHSSNWIFQWHWSQSSDLAQVKTCRIALVSFSFYMNFQLHNSTQSCFEIIPLSFKSWWILSLLWLSMSEAPSWWYPRMSMPDALCWYDWYGWISRRLGYPEQSGFAKGWTGWRRGWWWRNWSKCNAISQCAASQETIKFITTNNY